MNDRTSVTSNSRPSSALHGFEPSWTSPPAADNYFYHNGQHGQHGNPWQQNDYLTQYYANYYRQYYARVMAQSARPPPPLLQPQTPRKHSTCHARASFGAGGRLVSIEASNTRVALRPLAELLEPAESWPLFESAPLVLLEPSEATRVALQWAAHKSAAGAGGLELRLVLRVVCTLLRQSGRVSGQDLAEILGSLVTEPYDDAADAPLAHFRRLLSGGQQRAALHFASQSGLHEHALALAYLTDPTLSAPSPAMSAVIRRFIGARLAPEDPIAVLFSALLTSTSKSAVSLTSLSLSSFVTLVANEVRVSNSSSFVTASDTFYPNLIKLVISLSSEPNDEQTTTNVCDDFVDHVILNECLEFALFLRTRRMTFDLLLQKLVFASLLFDFGLEDVALKYAHVIRNSGFCLTETASHVIAEMERRAGLESDEAIPLQPQSSLDDDDTRVTDQTTADASDDPTPGEESADDVEREDDQTTTDVVDMTTTSMSSLVLSPPTLLPTLAPPLTNTSSLNNSIADNSFVSFGAQTTARFDNSYHSDRRDDERGDSERRNEQKVNDTTTTTSTTSDESEKKESDDREKKSRFTSFIGSMSGLLSKTTRASSKAAVLPDDSNKSIVWDPKLNMWVDTSAPHDDSLAAALSQRRGPPTDAAIRDVSRPIGRSRLRANISSRYVDVFAANN